jgi:hypothetical protein
MFLENEPMRRLIAILFFLALSCVLVNPATAETFDSDEAFWRWLHAYYEHPQPERIPDALKYMDRPNVLAVEKDSPTPWLAPFMTGFLSGVFERHPEKIDDWLKVVNTQNDMQMTNVLQGIWFTGLPDAKARIHTLLDNNPRLKPSFTFAYHAQPDDIENLSLNAGAWVIDALWGKFMATGDDYVINKIVIAASIDNSEISPKAHALLLFYARHSPRVLNICENMLHLLQDSLKTEIEDSALQKATRPHVGKVIHVLEKIINAARSDAGQGRHPRFHPE